MDNIEEDKLLLQGLLRSDKESIEQIYKANYNMVKNYVVQNNGSTDDSADLFQECMIVLYEKMQSGDFELHSQLKTYIYSVCRRLWLKKLQQQSRFSSGEHYLEETVSVEEDLEVHEKKEAEFHIMDSAMQKVGEPCKSLLEAYYIKKKGMTEIAEDFGYTNADNAKTQKYKCLVRLKKLFFAQYKNGDK